jgi:hypothetical protein
MFQSELIENIDFPKLPIKLLPIFMLPILKILPIKLANCNKQVMKTCRYT